MKKNNAMPFLTKTLLFLVSFSVFIEAFYFFSFFLPVLFFLLLTRQLRFSSTGYPAWILLILLSLAYLMALPGASDVDDGITAFKFIIYSFLVMFFISTIIISYGNEAIEIICKSTAALTFIAAIYSQAVFLGVLPLTIKMISPDRLQGFSGNPNNFGIEIDMAIMYLYYQIGRVPALSKKIVIFSGILVLVLTLLLTYSRGSWGALILAVISYSCFTTLQKKTAAGLLKLMGAFAGIALIAGLTWGIADNLGYTESLKQRITFENYDNERFFVHSILWEKSFDYPLGMGPGQTANYLSNFYNNLETIGSSQETYLGVLFESGFIGLFLYAFFVIYLSFIGFRISSASWELAKISAVGTSLFYGVLLVGIVDDTMLWRYFWMIAGMVSGLYVLYSKDRQKKRSLING